MSGTDFTIEIGQLLEEIHRKWNTKGELNAIDRDILKEKVRLVYELLERYEPPSLIKEDNEPVLTAQADSKAPVEEIVNAETDQVSQTSESVVAEEEVIEPQEKVEQEEVPTEAVDEQNEEPATKEPEELPGENVHTDSSPETSVQEKLAAELSNENDLASKLQGNDIPDLTKAISLNQRFEFTNELFGGNGEAYETALTDLNSRNELNEAISLLKELKTKYDWQDDNSSLVELHHLVERRYK